MADINLIKIDREKEIQGIWVDFAIGIRLKIARARNPKYQERLRNLTEDLRPDLRKEDFDFRKLEDVLLQVRAETILLGWENIEEEGQQVPYSPEKAAEYFRNPELKDFYQFVVAVSENADKFRKQFVEESEKN